jgi:hypothetical protein
MSIFTSEFQEDGSQGGAIRCVAQRLLDGEAIPLVRKKFVAYSTASRRARRWLVLTS